MSTARRLRVVTSIPEFADDVSEGEAVRRIAAVIGPTAAAGFRTADVLAFVSGPLYGSLNALATLVHSGRLRHALRVFTAARSPRMSGYGLDRAYRGAPWPLRMAAARAIAVPMRLDAYPEAVRTQFAPFFRSLRGSLDALATLVHRDLFVVAFAHFRRRAPRRSSRAGNCPSAPRSSG